MKQVYFIFALGVASSINPAEAGTETVPKDAAQEIGKELRLATPAHNAIPATATPNKERGLPPRPSWLSEPGTKGSVCVQNEHAVKAKAAPPKAPAELKDQYAGIQALSMSYVPQTTDYPYSLDACEYHIDPDWPQFTMQVGERLQDFWNRAYENNGRPKNLVLNIPWDAPTHICDQMYSPDKKWPDGTLVVRGISGPDGQKPRFYCRSEQRDGNVPKRLVKQAALIVGAKTLTVFDNLHTDGYKKAGTIRSLNNRILFKNSYLHHAISNGLSFSNVNTSGKHLQVEICGNEISHNGMGNTQHGMYMHRGLGDAHVKIILANNLIHSNNWSSGFKSIANENWVVGNRFFSSIDDDPTFKRTWSSMDIDIAACSTTLIEDNSITHWKPFSNKLGKEVIGIRKRSKVVNGCDDPPYGSETFNDPEYWRSLKGAKLFVTKIRNNVIRARPDSIPKEATMKGEGDFGHMLYAITDWGTWPSEEFTLGASYWLQPPVDNNGKLLWYERHKVIVHGNRYIGFAADQIYRSLTTGTCSDWRKACPPPPDIGPMRYYGTFEGHDAYSYFEIGKGETIVKTPND